MVWNVKIKRNNYSLKTIMVFYIFLLDENQKTTLLYSSVNGTWISKSGRRVPYEVTHIIWISLVLQENS